VEQQPRSHEVFRTDYFPTPGYTGGGGPGELFTLLRP